MSVGVNLNFANLFDGMSDKEMYDNEMRLAVAAEDMGYDSLWCVEHHFYDYAMCPSNFLVLANLAGRTKNIKLGLGAIILPWHHDLLRVIENIAQLDNLTEGRLLVSFGRGLCKEEYEGFRVDMADARARFDEAAKFVLQSLDTGFAEYEGRFYRQPRVEIRPRIAAPLDGRLYAVATSPESMRPVAELGGRLVCINQGGFENLMPGIEIYREVHQQNFGRPAPGPLISETVFCHADPAVAEREAREYMTANLVEIIKHYHLFDANWDSIKGYESYRTRLETLQAVGKDAMMEGYFQSQLWGTPDQILAKYEKRLKITGGHEEVLGFSYGGMAYDQVEDSMKLFAQEVLPAIRAMKAKELEPA